MTFAALIPIFLANLPELLKAGQGVTQFAHEFRAAARQSKEWTPDHERDFLNKLADAARQPHWQPDGQTPERSDQ